LESEENLLVNVGIFIYSKQVNGLDIQKKHSHTNTFNLLQNTTISAYIAKTPGGSISSLRRKPQGPKFGRQIILLNELIL